MASSVFYKTMARVSPAGVGQKLTAFFASTACDVFDESRRPNATPDETRIRDEVLTPLQWLLCGGDPAVVLRSLEEHRSHSSVCGKVYNGGEPVYFCKDCQTGPNYCLCKECFDNSEHKNHQYRLFPIDGGGCCDCGDPEAWTSFVHCDIHKPDEPGGPEVDPVDALPPDLANRSQTFFSTLLWYCMDMLCWEDTHSLPETLMQGKTSECISQPTFMSFLYNDEVHSADQVILSLISNMQRTHTDAISLATFTKRSGRAVVKCGTEEDCLQTKESINRNIASEVPLKVMVFHSAVAAHQSNAILCLSLLKKLAEKPAFRRLISEALVEVSNSAGCCILDRYFLNDSKMWITARIRWHRLVMSSIFMDPKWKPQLAINLTKNYSELLKNFVDDSHEIGVCASNLALQICPVPALSHMLVARHGLLQKIIGTLIQVISPCQHPNTGVIQLTPRNYKHSRIFFIFRDLKQVLGRKPKDWNDMREHVLAAFKLLLDLLGMVQNAGQVKRQLGTHVLFEEPWQSTFNFFAALQQPLLLFIDWCTSDQMLLQEAVRLTVKKHEEVANRVGLQSQMHEVTQELVGTNKMELYKCDMQKEPVSVHQPLPRVLAGLLAGASAHNMSLSDLLQIPHGDVQTPLFLMEHSSRVVVMAGQVLAGMWKRNGTSLLHQVIMYHYKDTREMMYDKDIVMLQAMAAILDPSIFLYALIYKFRLDTWLASPDSPDRDPSLQRGENSEDALRFFLREAEEFVFLLIAIFCERFVKGVGEGVTTSDTLKREIIHKLLITSRPHSQIQKEFVHMMEENDNEVDEALKEVATLRKGGGTNRPEFVLKAEYEAEYNPFHYHYSQADHCMAEDVRRKRMKCSGMKGPESALPRDLPPFCPPFQGIMRLTSCPVMHRILHCVFTHAADPESVLWSGRLLHEALFLCAMMLKEEDPTRDSSLCNAAIGKYGANQFLDILNTLLTSRRAEEHKSLLTWIIKFLKDHRDEATGCHSPPTEVVKEAESDQPQGSRAREELASKRQRVMAQMQSMQRRFLEKNKKQLEEMEGKDEMDTGIPQSFVSSPPLHAVGVDSLINHTAQPKEVTCILCQEETKDFASQEKVLVQAVRVQRSCVLKQGEDSSGMETDFLTTHTSSALGTCTSGCGHHIHADCWKQFIESKRQEHSRRHFFPLPGQSVQWAAGEFLCPLCQCFSNTVLPLLPPLSPTSPSLTPLHSIGFSEWRDIVRLAMELAEDEDDPLHYTSTCTSPTLWDRLQELFNFQKPSAYNQKSENDMASVIGLFTQSTYMRAYKADPDEANERVCVATWNNCAYTISSLQLSSRQEDKFLLTCLSTRQLDYLSSLAKMGCDPKLRPQLKQLSGHVRKLINTFLLESPPSGDVPSIVELNTFFMMVYLHFAVVSLLAALVSPSGCLEDSPILPALTGATMEQVVRTATAARLVQYLLCCPPGQSTGSGAVSTRVGGDEEDTALQKLWVYFRHQAGFPSATPPDPSNLLSGVRDYLDPFLQCAVLFCQSFTGINFVEPEHKSSLFSEMCKFLNLPTELHTLFEGSAQTSQYSIKNLARFWCEHNQIQKYVRQAPTFPQLRSVIGLPPNFSELLNKASGFKCPSHMVEDDVSQVAMLCLLCGKMLCTNSHCCTFEVEEEDGSRPGRNTLRVGGFTHHTQSCSGGVGMGLWIQEGCVVLLDATVLHRVRGCTLIPPYLDEYGESDPGLRRGNPLYLHEESLQDLRKIWFQHRVPEKIIQQMESNPGQMKFMWSRM